MTDVQSQRIPAAGYMTYYYQSGADRQHTILLLHGSGPGVSAWSNWQFALPELGNSYRCIAPDLYGFGQSEHPQSPPSGTAQWLSLWLKQTVEVLDHLGLERVDLVGNSMGGGLALHLLQRYPNRFNKVVLMGPVGVQFPITEGLEQAWGFYRHPSQELLTRLVRGFVHDPASIGGNIEAIAQDRWKSVMTEDNRRSFEAMFPGDLQAQLDALVVPDDDLRAMPHHVLITHGREDIYIPLENSFHLLKVIPQAQLHVFNYCGHWIQIERRTAFNHLLAEWFGGRLE